MPKVRQSPPNGGSVEPLFNIRIKDARFTKALRMFSVYDVLRYFNRAEFSNPDGMNHELLLKLDWARHLAEQPFNITSSFRARDDRTHGKGLAVDIACTGGAQRLPMLRSLLAVGFDRIGIYEHHIHVDVSISDPPAIWWGTYPGPARDLYKEEAP